MKDKNGVEIECQNCAVFKYCKHAYTDAQCQNRAFFSCAEDYEARIVELIETVAKLREKLARKERERRHESSLRDRRIAELQAENTLLKESRFTDDELDLIRNTFQADIWEDKCGWSAEKRIIAKCDRILKVRKD